jgi:isocitrate/isopropylmalate dehydrogenase
MIPNYVIPVIPGDGIGPEVIAQGRRILDAAAEAFGFSIEWREYPFGADHYLRTGTVLAEAELNELASSRAIYFGACGDPRVAPGILERGLVIEIRNRCDQYVNLRPVKLLPGVQCPLRDVAAEDIDMVVIRENTEDFYVAVGGRLAAGKSCRTHKICRSHFSAEMVVSADYSDTNGAYQVGIVTEAGVRRVLRYAFELARKRRRHVTSIDKANVLTEIYGLWREEFATMSREYPDVRTEQLLVDAAAMMLVRQPQSFDVLVMPNMFGDILSEIGAAIQGGLGFSPAANINPTGNAMFEPIHGSAPQLKGMNYANPIAAIWAGSLMLEFIGQGAAAEMVLSAIAKTTAEGEVKTRDVGGNATTSNVGDEVLRNFVALSETSQQA